MGPPIVPPNWLRWSGGFVRAFQVLAVAEAAVLRAVVVGIDSELLEGVRIRDRIASIPQRGKIGAAIQIIVDGAHRGVGVAVDEGSLRRKAESNRTGSILDAGSRVNEL